MTSKRSLGPLFASAFALAAAAAACDDGDPPPFRPGAGGGGGGGGAAGRGAEPAFAEQIAVGNRHACAAVAGGRVRCWGYSDSGQLGNGSRGALTLRPVQVRGPDGPLSGVKVLGLGAKHGCLASTGDYNLRCWGDNDYGQLGDGDTDDNGRPIRVVFTGSGPVEDVTALALGARHSCALSGAGAVVCWGDNAAGQLGDGTTAGRSRAAPVEVEPGVPLGDVRALSAGANFTCALLGDGQVRCWGGNEAGQLGDGTTLARPRPTPVELLSGLPLTGALAIDAGGAGACALLEGGFVTCWGVDGATAPPADQPPRPSRPTSVRLSPDVPLSGALAVAVGDDHACALLTEGAVRCWGGNAFGQLGDGTAEPSANAVPVEASPGAPLRGAQSLELGRGYGCVTKTGGEMLCWGRNANGQLGDGTTTDRPRPTPVDPSAGLLSARTQALALGADHACTLTDGGEVRCWGTNEDGRLGDAGSRTDANTSTTVEVAPGRPLTGVTSVALSGDNSCAVRTDGTTFCWGALNLTTPFASAFQGAQNVNALALVPADDFSLRSGGACARTTAGGVLCWGVPLLGAPTDPVQIELSPGSPLTGVSELTVRDRQACATTEAGQVVCWGTPLDAFDDPTPPAPVLTAAGAPLSGVEAVTLGGGHACALVANGEVRCWGENRAGQLGDGTTDPRPSAAPVTISPGVPLAGVRTVIATGSDFSFRRGRTCALTAGGEVYCWGHMGFYEADNQTKSHVRTTPGPVGTAPGVPLRDVRLLASSPQGDYACAVDGGGKRYCWTDLTRGDDPALIAVDVTLGEPLEGVKALAIAPEFGCALTDRGEVYCWNADRSGRPVDASREDLALRKIEL
jgi:alpha-tubulin suppressor-like RCC1 family protein